MKLICLILFVLLVTGFVSSQSKRALPPKDTLEHKGTDSIPYMLEMGITKERIEKMRIEQDSLDQLQIEQERLTQERIEEDRNRSRVVGLGFTKSQILKNFGEPKNINRTVGTWGVHEQWVYSAYPNTLYIYFENGIVTSWQD